MAALVASLYVSTASCSASPPPRWPRFYHNILGWTAPYPALSLPALLGSIGGAGLLVGPAGLLWLKLRRPPERHDQAQLGMDIVLLVLLFETSLSGLMLRAWHESAAMGPLLGIHLGAVAGLFLLLPYGKFVHGPVPVLCAGPLPDGLLKCGG